MLQALSLHLLGFFMPLLFKVHSPRDMRKDIVLKYPESHRQCQSTVVNDANDSWVSHFTGSPGLWELKRPPLSSRHRMYIVPYRPEQPAINNCGVQLLRMDKPGFCKLYSCMACQCCETSYGSWGKHGSTYEL